MVQLGADDRVGSTQFAMSLEHCSTRLVSRPEDLGVASALFERPSEPCAAALVLWVATGRRFEGRTHPELVRTVSGRVHLLVTRSPAPSPGDALPVLRAVAGRAQRRLEE